MSRWIPPKTKPVLRRKADAPIKVEATEEEATQPVQPTPERAPPFHEARERGDRSQIARGKPRFPLLR